MTTTTTAGAVRFNPFGEAFRRDPYSVYAELRRREPLHRFMGTWVLTRYRDVADVLKDRRFSSNLFPNTVKRNKPDFGDPAPDAIEAFVAKAIVFTENPDHARLRRLVNPSFNEEAIAAERPLVERIVDEFVSGALARRACDAIAELADLIPLYVTAERIGLPRAIYADIRGWVHEARRLLDPGLMSRADYRRTYDGLKAFIGVLRALLPERRARPGHDLMSQLLAARHGEDRLTDDEVVLTCIMSFVAGTETTKFLIGNGILAFLQHPEEIARLRRRPELLGNAVDEVLRFDAPLQQTKRIALRDVQMEDVTIAEGEQVLLCLGAANRDPEEFPDPDRFDISRQNSASHLGLGYGMRGCLGGTMASLEARVVFERLFLRDVEARLATTDFTWQEESRILRGPAKLPLRLSRVDRAVACVGA